MAQQEKASHKILVPLSESSWVILHWVRSEGRSPKHATKEAAGTGSMATHIKTPMMITYNLRVHPS